MTAALRMALMASPVVPLSRLRSSARRCSTMQPPLAPGTEEPVDRQDPHHLLPVRALAARRQPRAEERVQPQPLPELVAQPARAPLARMLQPQFTQPHLQRGHLARRRRAVRGKQGQLPRLPTALVNHRDCPLPRLPLTVVDFTQIQHVPLRHFVARVAPTLHDPHALDRLVWSCAPLHPLALPHRKCYQR